MNSYLAPNKLTIPEGTSPSSLFVYSGDKSVYSLADKVFPGFQPIIEVASGKIQSYEALARTTGAQGELISAGHFFTSNELNRENRLLLDRAVRAKALAQVQHMPADTSLAINISPQWITSLDHADIIPTLDMIDKLDIDPKRLIIELTEFRGDMDRILEVVECYRSLGIRLAIDDFGSGFSQLDRVIALEPDIIKLDMKLFKQASQGGIAEVAVESLTELAIRCGSQIVCEGVETEEEFYFGLRCGARYMQGFLFSKAQEHFLPTDHFVDKVAYLRKSFFETRRRWESEKIAHIGHIKKMVYELKQQLQLELEGQDTISVESLALTSKTDSLIRFYICDHEGNQLTPNFDYDPVSKRLQKDPQAEGYNWAWRPYFYQLSAIIPQQPNRLVASSRYEDISSGEACKTIATQLDHKRVLLVDVLAYWD